MSNDVALAFLFGRTSTLSVWFGGGSTSWARLFCCFYILHKSGGVFEVMVINAPVFILLIAALCAAARKHKAF